MDKKEALNAVTAKLRGRRFYVGQKVKTNWPVSRTGIIMQYEDDLYVRVALDEESIVLTGTKTLVYRESDLEPTE